MSSLALLLSLLATAPDGPEVQPQATAGVVQPAREWKLRLALPWLSGRYEFLGPKSDHVFPEHYKRWQPNILLGSLGCEFAHRWAVEVGGGLVYDLRREAYARGGPMLALVELPTLSLNLQGVLSLAYRSHAHPRASGATGRQTLWTDAGLAIDVTRWWSSGWGFSFRGRGALARVLAASGSKLWDDPEDPGVTFQDDARWALELGFDLGLAWR